MRPIWLEDDGVRTAIEKQREDRAKMRAEDLARRVEWLEERLDRQDLFCAALWSLLQEKVHLSDKLLLERVRQLDLADGHLDGKITQTPQSCPKCHRTLSKRHLRCIYCGAEVPRLPFPVGGENKSEGDTSAS